MILCTLLQVSFNYYKRFSQTETKAKYILLIVSLVTGNFGQYGLLLVGVVVLLLVVVQQVTD